jgi:hypothetical protein
MFSQARFEMGLKVPLNSSESATEILEVVYLPTQPSERQQIVGDYSQK